MPELSPPRRRACPRRRGGEIVGHGISNSDGRRPGGWSSPWLTHTPSTVDLLAATGYRYLLDLRADDRPVWLSSTAGPVLSISYALELNDSSSLIGRQVAASDFADMIVDEFEELLIAAQDQPLVMSMLVHSFVSGAPFRLCQVSRALAHIASRSERVWLTQPRRIFDAFTAFSPPP